MGYGRPHHLKRTRTQGAVLPTGGKASVAGYDIMTDQINVRSKIGYCPQFDALFDLLTVTEHLEMYAAIKGVPGWNRPAAVEKMLAGMDLLNFRGKLAGRLSGGNKRKLSVAIAMIGSPPIVFLDEPSTGMDPVARRFMWDVIAKISTRSKSCSVVLTTHSMEVRTTRVAENRHLVQSPF
jgi:ATP-binding cassette subfamily A (ABC1) protein 3